MRYLNRSSVNKVSPLNASADLGYLNTKYTLPLAMARVIVEAPSVCISSDSLLCPFPMFIVLLNSCIWLEPRPWPSATPKSKTFSIVWTRTRTRYLEAQRSAKEKRRDRVKRS